MFFQNEIFLLDNTHPMLHRMGVIQKRSHCAMCSGIDDKWYLPCNDVVFLPYGDVDERPTYIEPWMAFPHEHNLSIGIWSSSYWSPRGHYSSAILCVEENKREKFINSNIICIHQSGGQKILKSPGQKLVKSNKLIFLFVNRETALLAVLNFFPVQKLNFGQIF